MIDIDETEKQVKLLQSKSFIRMQLGLPEVLELIELVRKERERAEAYKTMQRETAKAGREIRAERDAALAALERVRALETFSITDSYPAWTAVDHDDLLAALEAAEARVKELEAGKWEYAQAVIADDEGGLYLGKSFGDDPTRALDEGYVLVRRHVGHWVPVESEGTDD